MTTTTGMKVPNFTASATGDKEFTLSDHAGKYVVLYFYPKDNTPGCTVEAKEFRDAQDEFVSEDAVVLGVSPDPAVSHCKFIQRFELNFSLLADEDHKIAEKYGVWVEKNMYGKKYMGIERSTFLVLADGSLADVWRKVKVKGHAAAVLDTVREILDD